MNEFELNESARELYRSHPITELQEQVKTIERAIQLHQDKVRHELADNLTGTIIEALQAGVQLHEVRATFEGILDQQIELDEASELDTTLTSLMVECMIYSQTTKSLEYAVTSLETARNAVDVVLGKGRHVEYNGNGDGYLVKFTVQEYETLTKQGFVELAKGVWIIRAEMP